MLQEKIIKFIKFYSNGLNIQRLKIVMTSDTLEALKLEVQTEGLLKNIEAKNYFMGYPIEICNKIATDFYVCEILDN